MLALTRATRLRQHPTRSPIRSPTSAVHETFTKRELGVSAAWQGRVSDRLGVSRLGHRSVEYRDHRPCDVSAMGAGEQVSQMLEQPVGDIGRLV
jgi:hypothetical protein